MHFHHDVNHLGALRLILVENIQHDHLGLVSHLFALNMRDVRDDCSLVLLQALYAFAEDFANKCDQVGLEFGDVTL